MKIAFRGLLAMLADYWHSHTTRGKIWLFMGVVGLIVDAALCYQYGVTQTTWHGIGFALLAVFFSQLPDGAYSEFEKGHKATGWVLALLCLPIGAVAYQSHIGYGAGVRLGDIKQASIQDARYDGAQDTAKENAANLAMWKKQLADLNEKAPWAATVQADGLRDSLKTAEEAIRQETARGGCGRRCMSRMKERDEISEKIAVAEQASDLSKRIEATQRLVDKYRVTASTTQAGMSSVAMQTTANTQIFGVLRAAYTGENLETAMAVTEQSAKLANLIITAAGALAFMLMAPIGFFMAGRNRFEMPEDYFPPVRRTSVPTVYPANKVSELKPVDGNSGNGRGNQNITVSVADDVKTAKAIFDAIASARKQRAAFA